MYFLTFDIIYIIGNIIICLFYLKNTFSEYLLFANIQILVLHVHDHPYIKFGHLQIQYNFTEQISILFTRRKTDLNLSHLHLSNLTPSTLAPSTPYTLKSTCPMSCNEREYFDVSFIHRRVHWRSAGLGGLVTSCYYILSLSGLHTIDCQLYMIMGLYNRQWP